MSHRTSKDTPGPGAEPHGTESVNRTPIGPGPETHGGRREPVDESGGSTEQPLEPVETSTRGEARDPDARRNPVGDESDLHAGEGSEGFDSPSPRGDARADAR